jgi:CheY-like chemotaxis protein
MSIQTRTPEKRRVTILIVEDEYFLRETVAEYLRDCGWNVVEAASGEDALLHLGEAPEIDVVFTDIRLGGRLNGWDLGEAFRREQPGLAVMYATARTLEPERRVEGSLFFDKPYVPEQIRAAGEQLLNARVF